MYHVNYNTCTRKDKISHDYILYTKILYRATRGGRSHCNTVGPRSAVNLKKKKKIFWAFAPHQVRSPGFGSGIFHNAPGVLQDQCALL